MKRYVCVFGMDYTPRKEEGRTDLFTKVMAGVFHIFSPIVHGVIIPQIQVYQPQALSF